MKTITGLTQLEAQVLKSIASMMYAEYGFSDVGASDVSEHTGIDMKVIRGVISSLVKKGHISPLEIRSDQWGYQRNDRSWEPIIYLCGDAEGLVAKWANSGEVEAAEIA